MEKYANETEIEYQMNSNHKGGELIGIRHGAENRFSMGISYYFLEEYAAPGVHEYQEGFYVLEGNGYAKIGDEEFEIFPGMSFIARAGEPHTIKKKKGSVQVKVLWASGAA